MCSLLIPVIRRGVLSGVVVSTVDFCVLIAASAASVSFEWSSILSKRLTRRMTGNSVTVLSPIDSQQVTETDALLPQVIIALMG